MNINALYQQIILDHNRHPLQYFTLEHFNRQIEGDNPLCGDQVTITANIVDSCIQEAAFQGSGCAICIASTSLLMQAIQNKPIDWSQQLCKHFFAMLNNEPYDQSLLGKIEALKGVNQFPVRIKCATLSWHAWHALSENNCHIISTEDAS